MSREIAQSPLNLEQWQNALNSAEKALSRGKIEQVGNMHLAMGMANFNLENYDESLLAFTAAKKIKSVEKMATQWFAYVKREQGNQMRLAMLN